VVQRLQLRADALLAPSGRIEAVEESTMLGEHKTRALADRLELNRCE
jgi:hypothetical protein